MKPGEVIDEIDEAVGRMGVAIEMLYRSNESNEHNGWDRSIALEVLSRVRRSLEKASKDAEEPAAKGGA
jgi:hypothetical protein